MTEQKKIKKLYKEKTDKLLKFNRAYFDKDKPIVFVCKLGQQSTFAAKRLQRESGPTVYRLKGGIMEWRASQMPLIQ